MPAQRIGKAEVVLVHLLSSHLLATAFTHINSNQHTNLAELTFYALGDSSIYSVVSKALEKKSIDKSRIIIAITNVC